MTAKVPEVNCDRVFIVGSQIMAAALARRSDPSSIGDDSLDTLADLAVRATIALDGAVHRAQERFAAEAKAADAAEAATAAAAKVTAIAEEKAAAKARADAERAKAEEAAAERALAAKAPAEKQARA